MEEIEVGEYVRTDKGTIGKVVEIRLGTNDEIKNFINIYFFDNCKWTIKDYIMKHSKNIIDLIEVGDYVNGNPVHKYNGNTGIVSINELGWTFIAFKDKKYPIETIVTREQFASMEYKIQN